MACPYAGREDVPVILWIVARRENIPPFLPLYYVGPVIGWVDRLDDAAVWPSHKKASAVAANFPGAVAMRVHIWEPLSRSHAVSDLVDLMYGG